MVLASPSIRRQHRNDNFAKAICHKSDKAFFYLTKRCADLCSAKHTLLEISEISTESFDGKTVTDSSMTAAYSLADKAGETSIA